jgi:hypothetical protein
MKRIGLIGEHPNDTSAIDVLLSRLYPNRFEFFPMLINVNGSKLEHQKIKRFLRNEYISHKPDWVIFIRDLDGLENEKAKINQKKRYFAEFRTVVGHRINSKTPNRNALYLLHVWEIEALIFSDIRTFNEYYGCEIEEVENPMFVVKPKEELTKVAPYKEMDCSEIFKKINLEKIRTVKYLNRFLVDFERLLA